MVMVVVTRVVTGRISQVFVMVSQVFVMVAVRLSTVFVMVFGLV